MAGAGPVTEPVAVLGAGGLMGQAMAANLARAGRAVRAWNRSPDKAESLTAHGAIIAATPAEAAHGAHIVITMLADADAVISTMDGPGGALAEMDQDSIWLQDEHDRRGRHGDLRRTRRAARRHVRRRSRARVPPGRRARPVRRAGLRAGAGSR